MYAPCSLTAPAETDSPTAGDIEALIDLWCAREGETQFDEPAPVCERPFPRHRLRDARTARSYFQDRSHFQER